MAGWGDNWGFDWGNAVLNAAVTLTRIQVNTIVRVPTIVSPTAAAATPARIAVSANVRTPTVNATNQVTFSSGQPFAIYRSVTAGSAVARTVTTPAGV